VVEMTTAEHVRPGDRISIPTSGHSGASPDASVEVLAIAGAARPVFRVRLLDGREDFYVPAREVRRARPALSPT
jgi:hypothetical protein